MDGQISHPQLGLIQGQVADGLVNFLGLKYATIANRFDSPKLAVPGMESAVNATKYGFVQPSQLT